MNIWITTNTALLIIGAILIAASCRDKRGMDDAVNALMFFLGLISVTASMLSESIRWFNW